MSLLQGLQAKTLCCHGRGNALVPAKLKPSALVFSLCVNSELWEEVVLTLPFFLKSSAELRNPVSVCWRTLE